MTEEQAPRNIGLDLVRVTETAALAAGRWVGSGDYFAAHRAATRAMLIALNTLDMDGRIVIGEEHRIPDEEISLCHGQKVGNGHGPKVDLMVDPIDGTNLLIKGQPGAVSIVGVAPRHSVWASEPALYMNKLVVEPGAAKAIVPECLNAPAAWTLALVARVVKKAVHDLSVIVLDRERNQDLIEEIRTAGARVILRSDGDAEGALIAATAGVGIDLLMGIGGAAQGVLSACAVKASGGAMLAQLAPQTEAERLGIRQAGLDEKKVLMCNDMITSDEIFFAVTGITNTRLLQGMEYHSSHATTHSLLIRSETGTRRFMRAEHFARI
ncbi:MAG: class II fructose-bisphosphatase [Chloroflexi bacterium]|nr:class II fructose-bisphosphatase [Chloroflexota bacterium]